MADPVSDVGWHRHQGGERPSEKAARKEKRREAELTHGNHHRRELFLVGEKLVHEA
jgi:hypothetical protein